MISQNVRRRCLYAATTPLALGLNGGCEVSAPKIQTSIHEGTRLCKLGVPCSWSTTFCSGHGSEGGDEGWHRKPMAAQAGPWRAEVVGTELNQVRETVHEGRLRYVSAPRRTAAIAAGLIRRQSSMLLESNQTNPSSP
jgi:hypothetical protein